MAIGVGIIGLGMAVTPHMLALRDLEAAGRVRIIGGYAPSSARRDAFAWQGAKLMSFAKPTIAMVNGWCFGGAFTPMASCDLAIAADEATFGVSEINWGILPGGNVTKVLSQLMGRRAALYVIMTGIPFDGRKAEAMGLVNDHIEGCHCRAVVEEMRAKLVRPLGRVA